MSWFHVQLLWPPCVSLFIGGVGLGHGIDDYFPGDLNRLWRNIK